MAHLIDKDAVIADIERRIKTNKECMLGLRNLDYYQGKVDALNHTISFINTLEVKEVDLKEEIQSWVEDNSVNGYYREDVYETAEHFFELGLKANNPVTAVEPTESHLQEPTVVYVVSRGEEHSDYVEEVFFDENKAQKYCDQFKGDENEYVRHITKVKVTL